MHWKPDIGVGDLLTAALLLLTLASLIYAAIQVKRNTLAEHSQFSSRSNVEMYVVFQGYK